jgi:hypothetical protein
MIKPLKLDEMELLAYFSGSDFRNTPSKVSNEKGH